MEDKVEKDYTERLFEIFKGLKSKGLVFSLDEGVEEQFVKMFDLENQSLLSLRSIRNEVVKQLSDKMEYSDRDGSVEEVDREQMHKIMNIVSVATSIIDNFIWKKGGQP